MIVSILPAAQLSQIELLFAPYTHDKMHFSFFIRYRFSDFFFIWLLLSESVFPPRLTIWELLVRCFGCSTLSCDYLDTTCWWYNLIISHSTHQTPQLWEIQSPCRPSRLFGKRCKHYYQGCADDQGHFPLHVNHEQQQVIERSFWMIQVHVLIPVKLMIKLGFYVGGILAILYCINLKPW